MKCPCCERNTPQETDTPQCPHCGEFVDLDWVLNHVREDREEIEWECNRCEKYFNVRVYIDYSFEVTK